MNASKKLKFTVVIPAYNEEKLIDECLEALANQTRPVDEIIVVDNNSVDRTAARAKTHAGVTLITEKNQGITYARTAGFDAATGDIIGRIDVDTIVAPEWAEVIERRFLEDPELAALGGDGAVAELSPKGRFWMGWYFPLFRRWNAPYLGFGPVVYGFNGAFRSSAWHAIRGQVTLGDKGLNEDLDLTICLLKNGLKIGYEKNMRVKFHLFQQWTPKKLRFYYNATRTTLTKHQYGNPKLWHSSRENTASR